MPAIKAVNSKGLRVINCRFEGFETDIELDNVEDFVSADNKFSSINPQALLIHLINTIKGSSISQEAKKQLVIKIIDFLSDENKTRTTQEKESIRFRIIKVLGSKAADYFIQLAAAVSAGFIIRKL